MTPDALAPNLYQHFQLDTSSTSRELGILLSAQDARLEGMGFEIGDDQRQEAQIAHTILCSPEIRATYDEGLDQGLRPTWAQLSELAAYGEWPQSMYRPSPFAGPGMGQQQGYTQYAEYGQAQHSPYAFDPFQQQAAVNLPAQRQRERPQAGTRVVMSIIDSFIASFVGLVGFAATDSDWAFSLVSVLLVCLYYVGFDVLAGGTPAKLMMGYRVQDVTTQRNISWAQSFKRQWWRLIAIVPGLGTVASPIAALCVLSTINEANQLRGQHDQLANAEVVKKQR